ncbi:hypothetical protein [Salinirubrum litoreum]|uniref:Transcriptional initiation protein Tat n=1 Tax=Salinirubrum litoreum TaxID=1126234 RepID=A0ABD5RAH3_9EURY|nr:hypothetical protein [Salinirubrum litoreum]
MRRRALLTALTAGVAGLGGCLGPAQTASGPRRAPDAPASAPRESDPGPVLVISDFRTEADDGGGVRAVVVVSNRAESARTTTVTGTLRFDGEEYVRTAERTVPAGGTSQVVFTYDVPYEAFQRNGAFVPSLD